MQVLKVHLSASAVKSLDVEWGYRFPSFGFIFEPVLATVRRNKGDLEMLT